MIKNNFKNLIVVILGIVLLSPALVYAGYVDREEISFSVGASSLDMEIDFEEGQFPIVLDDMSSDRVLNRNFTIKNTGGENFKYRVNFEKEGDDNNECGNLSLKIKKDDDERYNGLLQDLDIGRWIIDSGNDEELEFQIAAGGHTGVCSFNLLFTAWQTTLDNPTKGWIDTEILGGNKIDNTMPEVSIDYVELKNARNGKIYQDRGWIHQENMPMIVGTISGANGIKKVVLSVGVNHHEIIPSTSGEWRIRIAKELPEGDNSISVTATDNANRTITTTQNIFIDTKAPNAVHTFYKDGDKVEGFNVYRDDGKKYAEPVVIVNSVDKLSFTAEYSDESPSAGLYWDSYVIFQAQDDGSFRFSHDGKKAFCSWRSEPNLVKLFNNNDDINNKWILEGRVSFAKCKEELPDGEYYLAHHIYDKATRKDIPSIKHFRDVLGLHFIIDSTPPETDPGELSAVSDGVNSPVIITGTTSDASGVAEVNVYKRINGGNYTEENPGWGNSIATITDDSDTSLEHFQFDYAWTPEDNGVYDIKVAGTDIVGNVENSAYIYGLVYGSVEIEEDAEELKELSPEMQTPPVVDRSIEVGNLGGIDYPSSGIDNSRSLAGGDTEDVWGSISKYTPGSIGNKILGDKSVLAGFVTNTDGQAIIPVDKGGDDFTPDGPGQVREEDSGIKSVEDLSDVTGSIASSIPSSNAGDSMDNGTDKDRDVVKKDSNDDENEVDKEGGEKEKIIKENIPPLDTRSTEPDDQQIEKEDVVIRNDDEDDEKEEGEGETGEDDTEIDEKEEIELELKEDDQQAEKDKEAAEEKLKEEELKEREETERKLKEKEELEKKKFEKEELEKGEEIEKALEDEKEEVEISQKLKD